MTIFELRKDKQLEILHDLCDRLRILTSLLFVKADLEKKERKIRQKKIIFIIFFCFFGITEWPKGAIIITSVFVEYFHVSDTVQIAFAAAFFLIGVLIIFLLIVIILKKSKRNLEKILPLQEDNEKKLSIYHTMCNNIAKEYSLPDSLYRGYSNFSWPDYDAFSSILERFEKYKNESLKASINGYYATLRAQSGAAAAEWKKEKERREKLDRQYYEEVARQNDREVLQSINNKLDYWIHH